MPDIYLRPGEANPNDVRLRDPTGGLVSTTLVGGSVVFAPLVNQQVRVGLVGGSVVNAPTVAQSVSIGIVGGHVVFAPNVKRSVALGLVGGSVVFTPRLNQQVRPGLVGGSVVYSPTAAVQETNNPNFFNHYRRGEPYPAIRGLVNEWGFDLYRKGEPLNNLDTILPVVTTVTPGLVGGTVVFAPTVTVGALVPSGPPRHGARISGVAGRRLRRQLVVRPGLVGRHRVFAPDIEWNDDALVEELILELMS